MSSGNAKESGRTTMREPRVCCDQTFTDSMVYAQHIGKHHTRHPEQTCPECGKVVRGVSALRRHVEGHAKRIERFWGLVDKNGPNGCWVWTGNLRNRSGYGRISAGHSGDFLTHRFAYELVKGPIPEGLELDHLCGRKNCVNPDHLEPVTSTENIRRWAKRTNWDGIAGTQRKEPIVTPVSADPADTGGHAGS